MVRKKLHVLKVTQLEQGGSDQITSGDPFQLIL